MIRTLLSGRARAIALAAVPVLILLPSTPRPESVASGLTYHFVMRALLSDSSAAQPVPMMEGTGQVSGDKARVDFKAVTPPADATMSKDAKAAQAAGGGPVALFGKGSYFLMTRGGQTMTVVAPEKSQYYDFDIAGLADLTNGMSGMISMKVTDPHLDVQDLGAGEKILGYSTLHYRETQSMTMEMKVLFMKSKTTSHDTLDYLFAPDLKDIVNPFMKSSASMAGSFNFNSPEYAAQQKAAQEKMYKGVPLRMTIHGNSVDDKGKSRTHATIMEVTDIKRGDIAASVFEIPAGYTKVDSPYAATAAGGAANPNANATASPTTATDSSKNGKTLGGAVKDAAAEAAQDEAKNKAKKTVGKLFHPPA